MKFGKSFFNIFCAGAALTILAGCSTHGNAGGGSSPDKAVGIAMDTVFDVTVYGDEPGALDILEAAEELDTLVLSRYADSLISSYDSSSDASAVISGYDIDLTGIIEKCDEINAESDGAFDIRLGALSDLWNIDTVAKNEAEFVLPSEEEIKTALSDRSVYDLGSVGKGVFLDLAYEMLRENEASGAVISAGGSVLTYGEKNDGTDFRVAIASPFKEKDGLYGVIDLKGTYFISTSGTYERMAEYEGVVYHHILDPATGYPAWIPEDIAARKNVAGQEAFPVSVTVIAGSGLLSDALSTACFVMGVNEGMQLAGKYGAEVIYILDDGTCIYSDGLLKTEGETVVFNLRDE